ncbi:uncharacterized protein AKAME5_001806400 [Lates japonicus]|uniref:Uncharacterized protein n=1 Tax=Lates japonicus TaxID=270547 RepID=A0AAD3N6K2_LATJO|nr:uncharacterized protein AKAME5_001806400 [Lates japonicus]
MRSQPTVHHHTEPRSQTEQRLNVRACEFHPAGSEDMDTQDQEENAPQDRMGEDVTVENKHQAEQGPDRLQGDMEAEKDEHQAEVEAVRRSQRSAQPRQIFTYGMRWDSQLTSSGMQE